MTSSVQGAPVSVVLITYNEQDNIGPCLSALTWCDDVWVIDSYSTDRTVEMAKEWGAKVMDRKYISIADKRNFGLEQAPLKHDWVLHLDADEYVSRELAEQLAAIARAEPSPDAPTAYEVPFRMLFRGSWLRYGSTYPNYQVRFGRKNALRFVQMGHGQREDILSGRIGRTSGCLFHYNFSKGTAAWIRKHVQYAESEAQRRFEKSDPAANKSSGLSPKTRIRRWLKAKTESMPARGFFRFIYMYFIQLGFLDGAAGFHYCLLHAIYEHFCEILIQELHRGKDVFDVAVLPRGVRNETPKEAVNREPQMLQEGRR